MILFYFLKVLLNKVTIVLILYVEGQSHLKLIKFQLLAFQETCWLKQIFVNNLPNDV